MPSLHVVVIVLNWNGWSDTAACVRSVLQSTYADFDVMVVDNGSTDDSVIRLRREFPDLTILETGENLGFAGGNNAGMRHALDHQTADFIWLLNNDTQPRADAMEALVQAANAAPRVGALGALIMEAENPEIVQLRGGHRFSLRLGMPLPAPHGRPPDYLCGASMFLRRDCLEQCGLLDPGYFFYFEDTEFCFRIRRHNWTLAVEERAVVLHRGSASVGAGSFTQAYWYRRGLIRFLRTHAPFPWLPILGTTAARLLLAVLARNGPVLRGTWNGFWDGLAEPRPTKPWPADWTAS
ncbi:glycosyltransferase family 2 protein [Desulfonatronum lacustre]|uniref:glycosyltransferase family 2 protein n=1 Tax=Desulfonatronum lacustre TaxID=66849 RepID=UPI0004B08AC8|nr:glycosyltransferase family 2 protein [Desulfonatronum lacustre]